MCPCDVLMKSSRRMLGINQFQECNYYVHSTVQPLATLAVHVGAQGLMNVISYSPLAVYSTVQVYTMARTFVQVYCIDTPFLVF